MPVHDPAPRSAGPTHGSSPARTGRTWRRRWALAVGLGTLVVGCSLTDQLLGLRQLQLEIDRVTDVRLAGIDVDALAGGGDASALARLGVAMLGGRLPLEGLMHVRASNPAASATQFLAMDWTLLLAGHDTVHGTVRQATDIAGGGSADIPVGVRLDLLEFFGQDAGHLLRIAQAFLGGSRDGIDIGLRVFPILRTPLGPLRSPVPLTIAWRG